MLYIVGLGLNLKSISLDGAEKVKKCKTVYLENYTVDFPYNPKKLEEIIGKKIVSADREFIESLKILDLAKKQDVALLIYGSPLFATTHITIIEACKKEEIKFEIIYSASVLDAIAETGLQIYKFGKITSMPLWKQSYEPTSFLEIVKQNQSIESHSLILIDIGMEFESALEQFQISLKREKMEIKKIIICSSLGTKKSKIYFEKIENLKNLEIEKPFCFIIPGKLHFVEKEFLEKVQGPIKQI
jgi:diphthine synthase